MTQKQSKREEPCHHPVSPQSVKTFPAATSCMKPLLVQLALSTEHVQLSSLSIARQSRLESHLAPDGVFHMSTHAEE